VVVLNGGPGGYTLDGINYWIYVFSQVLRHRTLILFDPRGVGYSRPSLNCPEVEEQWQQDWAQNLSQQVSSRNYAQALRACHDRLTKAGVRLSAYTTAANAADVRDLRLALGYSKWDLYGGAYGSRLALAVMQEDPDGIRSTILDSADPPQVNLYSSQTSSLERSLQLVFQRCAANKNCSCRAGFERDGRGLRSLG
jgi:pimeloyl-ACP methyl ester carboxylesterase